MRSSLAARAFSAFNLSATGSMVGFLTSRLTSISCLGGFGVSFGTVVFGFSVIFGVSCLGSFFGGDFINAEPTTSSASNNACAVNEATTHFRCRRDMLFFFPGGITDILDSVFVAEVEHIGHSPKLVVAICADDDCQLRVGSVGLD